jgi:hypothetical protein
VIYTTRELINGRVDGNRPNPRPAGEKADRGDLWNGPEMGIKWAATGHFMPIFCATAEGPRGAKCLFSRRISHWAAIRPRNSRGDINKSAEL